VYVEFIPGGVCVTRVVYGAFRLRESLSGSLSVSYMRQLIGTGLLESLGGEFGE
jgi:hypothetical protein